MWGNSDSSNMLLVWVYRSWLGDLIKRSSNSVILFFSSWSDFSSFSCSVWFKICDRLSSSWSALSYSSIVLFTLANERCFSSSRAFCSRCFSRFSLPWIRCRSMSTAASKEALCIPSRTCLWFFSSKSVFVRFSFSLWRIWIYKKTTQNTVHGSFQ